MSQREGDNYNPFHLTSEARELLSTEPELELFFDELSTIDTTNKGQLPFTIRHIAHRVSPDYIGEHTVDAEARVFRGVQGLTRLGILRAMEGIESKTYCDGDYLPTFEFNRE